MLIATCATIAGRGRSLAFHMGEVAVIRSYVANLPRKV
jgi:hypothetical protein